MDPIEKAALHAAMYMVADEIEEFDEDGEVIVTPLAKPGEQAPMQVASDGKFVTFIIDGKPFIVPSVSHFKHLETRITQQDREILRLRNVINKVKTVVNSHAKDLTDVNRDLDRKVNMRDMI